MNRRPSQSRHEYDSFSPDQVSAFSAASPDLDFFGDRKKMAPGRLILRVVLLLLLAVIAVNLIINQFVFVHEETLPITGLIEAYDGFRVLHISDLKGMRFGSNQSMIRNALSRKHFDVALITGDMISDRGNAEPFYELLDVLNSLEPNAPIYLIAGDEDPEYANMSYASAGSPFAPWILGARQRGADYLAAPEYIERDGQRLYFMSLTHATLDVSALIPQYERRLLDARLGGDENEIELAEYQLSAMQQVETTRKSLQDSDIYLVLTHVPNTDIASISSIPPSHSYPLDIIFCGHYLGGMARLPFIGPLFVPSTALPRYGLLPGKLLITGTQRVGRTWISASSGLGNSDPLYPQFFMRLFNPPSVSIITLSSSSL